MKVFVCCGCGENSRFRRRVVYGVMELRLGRANGGVESRTYVCEHSGCGTRNVIDMPEAKWLTVEECE